MTKFENELCDLPRGWIWTQIKEIGANEAYAIVDGPFGSHLKISDYVKNGKIPAISITNIDEGFQESKLRYINEEKFNSIKRSAVKPGDIIVAKIGSSYGKCGYYPEWMPVGIIPANMLKITVNKLVNRQYVFFYLKSPLHRTFLDRITKSTAQPAFNVSSFRDLPFPLPPAMEQQRISTKIEELFSRLDAGVEGLRKVKAQLKRYRQAVLKYAFEGKLTEEWRKTHKDQIEPATKLLERIKQERRKDPKHKELPPVDAENLPIIPETWTWTRVGAVVEIIDYRGRTPPFSDEGIPHLRSSNIRNGKVIWEDLRYVSEEAYEKYMTRGLPQTGDLLFTTEAPLGEVALVPELKFSVAQRLMILRPMKNLLDSKFLLYQLMSSRFQTRLKRKGTGTTVTGVSSRNFKPVELVISPWAEQVEIVQEIERRLSLMEEIEKTVSISLKQADRLRGSILKAAFEGKLVRQDPSDEPAEKLLARIKAERANAKGKNNINKKKNKPKQLELSSYVE